MLHFQYLGAPYSVFYDVLGVFTLPGCAPDASWIHCSTFYMVWSALTKANLKRTINCKHKACAQNAVQTVWKLKRLFAISSAHGYSLQKGASADCFQIR